MAAASLSSDDSTGMVTANTASFAQISTDSVQAPEDAHSVRVRLMFRPAGPDSAVAYFDDVSFGPASPPSAGVSGAGRQSSAVTVARGDPQLGDVPPNAVAGVTTMGALYNGGGQSLPDSPPQASSSGGSQWLLWLALALPLSGIAALLTVPYLRRRLSAPTA